MPPTLAAVLSRVADETGVELQVLSGARRGVAHVPRGPPVVRLVGGPLLMVLDIGGGSLEIAGGIATRSPVLRGVAAAGRRPAHPRLVDDTTPPRVASRSDLREHIVERLGPGPKAPRAGSPGPGGGHVEDVPVAGPAQRCRPVLGGPAGATYAHRAGLRQVDRVHLAG